MHKNFQLFLNHNLKKLRSIHHKIIFKKVLKTIEFQIQFLFENKIKINLPKKLIPKMYLNYKQLSKSQFNKFNQKLVMLIQNISNRLTRFHNNLMMSQKIKRNLKLRTNYLLMISFSVKLLCHYIKSNILMMKKFWNRR